MQTLTKLVKEQATEPGRSSVASATLQDALRGLGATIAQLCKLSPGHIALQESTELLFRYIHTTELAVYLSSTSDCHFEMIAGTFSQARQLPRIAIWSLAVLQQVFVHCSRLAAGHAVSYVCNY